MPHHNRLPPPLPGQPPRPLRPWEVDSAFPYQSASVLLDNYTYVGLHPIPETTADWVPAAIFRSAAAYADLQRRPRPLPPGHPPDPTLAHPWLDPAQLYFFHRPQQTCRPRRIRWGLPPRLHMAPLAVAAALAKVWLAQPELCSSCRRPLPHPHARPTPTDAATPATGGPTP